MRGCSIIEIWTKIAEYFAKDMNTYIFALSQHLVLSLLSLAVAIVIGVPCGYLSVKNLKTEKTMVAIFQVLRIIPSLAVLILLIPFMGTGVAPAMVALTLLAVPPILINTITGFKEVANFMLETAAGMGMTERQQLFRVRFPLALPLIMTGIKIALIEIIASATLAAKIGAGGFGDIILTGLGLNRQDLLIIGGVSVALLSILAGVLLNLLDRALNRKKYIKKRRI